jgi:hypothetical protein
VTARVIHWREKSVKTSPGIYLQKFKFPALRQGWLVYQSICWVLSKFALKEQFVTNSMRTEKERLLLAYLAMERHRSHSRESLAELLWPDRMEGVARTNLRQASAGRAPHHRRPGRHLPLLAAQRGRHPIQSALIPYWIDTGAFQACFQSRPGPRSRRAWGPARAAWPITRRP